MGFKIKPMHIGIILILILFGNMIPLVGLRGESITLPRENIINYKLTQEQEDYAIKLGKTVISFEYDDNCEFCLNQKEFLEKIALEERGQIILQEIRWDVENSTRIRIISYYGEEFLKNPNEEKIWDMLCVLMVNPPTYCALREI